MILVRALARKILEQPLSYGPWSLQSTGMLRLYMDDAKTIRLHVYDPGYAADSVSDMHSHAWGFDSYILSGAFHQVRYIEYDEGSAYQAQEYAFGSGGGPKGDPYTVRLASLPVETWAPRSTYTLRAEEIHAIYPEWGTTTIIVRDPDEVGIAPRVFWKGPEYIPPRYRTPSNVEILDMTQRALSRW